MKRSTCHIATAMVGAGARAGVRARAETETETERETERGTLHFIYSLTHWQID